MQGLESRFSNDLGVNYVAFLEVLEPQEHIPLKFTERIKDLRAANRRPPLPEREPAGSLEEVFLKVKSKVIFVFVIFCIIVYYHSTLSSSGEK